MKTLIALLLVSFYSVIYVDAQEIITPPLKKDIPFFAGETLTYQVRYGILAGGTTTILLTDEVYDNNQVFHAKAIAQSTGIANIIYGVKDSYESWFDKVTTMPFKQVRDIREGSYTLHNEVTYNRTNNTVNSKLSGRHTVPENIFDLCSVFYYIRRVDFSKLNEGDVVFVNMFFGDEVFPAHLRYLGKETIRCKNGKTRCIKISPLVEVGRMFKNQDDLTIWYTDDNKCLPVLVRMEIRIAGAVHLKLIKHVNSSDSLLVQRDNL